MELYLGLEPFPDIFAVLTALREAGSKSPSSRTARRGCSKRLSSVPGLRAMFDAVLSADAVGVFKTHPEGYQHALE